MAYKNPADPRKRLVGKRSYQKHKVKRRAESAVHRANNLEHCQTRDRAWHAAHREQDNATRRERYARDPQHNLTKQKAYRLKNRARLNANRRANHAANPEKRRTKARQERAQNPDKVRAQERAQKLRHPEVALHKNQRRRALKNGATINDLTRAQWLEIQEVYDHRCVYCHKRRKGRLTQDHLTPLSQGGNHTASNVVPACGTCNARKRQGPVLSPVQPLLLTIAQPKKKKAS